MTGKRLRWLASAFMLVVILGCACIRPAQAQTRDFNVPAQSATTGIPQFARQAGIQILVAETLVRGKRVAAVTGPHSIAEALAILLQGTGLVASSKDGTTYTVALLPNPRSTSTSDALPAMSTQNSTDGDTPPGPANGRQAAQELEEVIVTAQKREERLQDVPIPMTVLNAQALSEGDQVKMQDYYMLVPGLSMSAAANGAAQLTIRGIATSPGNQFANPTVGIVVDDVPYGSSTGLGGAGYQPDIDPSDLAQLEVLRGPQGTLYGANSLGGLLKYVTQDPSTAGFSGRIQTDVDGVANGNSPGYGVRGAINVPIGDTMAVRASAFARRDPGYIDDVATGERAANWGNTDGGRLSGLWRPSDAFSLKLSALLQNSSLHGAGVVNDDLNATGQLLQNINRNAGFTDRQSQLFSAITHAKLGIFDLTSVTGYSIDHYSDVQDVSAFWAGLTSQNFGVTGTSFSDTNNTTRFTQELRLSASLGSILDWRLSGYYDHENSPYYQAQYAEDTTTGAMVAPEVTYDWKSTYAEYAAFADLTVHATDRLDIQVGGRESRIRQTYAEIDSGLLATFYEGGSPAVFPQVVTHDNPFTYLLTPRFKLTPDAMIYARLASGYRAGGPNQSAAVFGVPLSYKPDKTVNYELGIKGDVLGHVLSVDASVYYIDWQHIQVNVFDPANGGQYYANGSRAKSEGTEVSITSRPVTGLTISAWVAWDEAVLTAPFPPNSGLQAGAGERLPNSPRWSSSLSAREEFPLVGATKGFVAATVSYQGNRPEALSPNTNDELLIPSFTKEDLRAGASYGSWNAAVFVNNLSNARGLLNRYTLTPNPNYYYYIQPRTIGLTLSRDF